MKIKGRVDLNLGIANQEKKLKELLKKIAAERRGSK
jgi:hypothetical protein